MFYFEVDYHEHFIIIIGQVVQHLIIVFLKMKGLITWFSHKNVHVNLHREVRLKCQHKTP